MSGELLGCNVRKLFLQKKFLSYTIGFMENGEIQKAKIIIEDAKTPFGFEEFNKKKILNIEFYLKNPSHKKIHEEIQQMDNFFANLIPEKLEYFLPEDLIKKIKNKKYNSSLRVYNNKDAPLLKTFIRIEKNKNLPVFKNDQLCDSDIKNIPANFEITLSSLWISNTSFGLNWSLEKVTIN
jgi:hypothetical protein